MKTIYFVRHGESEANVGATLFQGEESLLTVKGHEQARFIAKRCERLTIDALIASPAVRTQATAKYISELIGKAIETESVFTERKLPDHFLGRPCEDPVVNREYEEWERGFFHERIRVGNGENFTDLKARVGKALAYLEKRPESSILVVTHGFFLRMLMAYITFGENLTVDEFKKIIQAFRTANTGLTLVESRPHKGGTVVLEAPRWLIRVWNDHAHLG